jgi:16S rRNA (guanine966-N2)-methyltransferase
VRVIAGSAKGVRLAPVPPGTRPMSDMAREGLFASLGAAVDGARVLDLFAGTGAVGIEALSRGADAAVFVERNPKALAAIRDNLGRAKLGDRARVERSAVEAWLARTAVPQQAFDLVSLDPPYDLDVDSIERLFAALEGGWLAGQAWTVVLTRGHKGSLPAVPVHWAVRRQLRYGDSLLTLYREERWA